MANETRSPLFPSPLLVGDGGFDVESRKRRIVRRATLGASAGLSSQAELIGAGVIHRVGKGRVLLTQGEAASVVALIGGGRVRLQRTVGEGKVLSLGYRAAGDIVGETSLAGVSHYKESAVATEDVEALVVPVSVLQGLMREDQALSAALFSVLGERHMDAEDRLTSMLFRNVEARLAELLLKSATRWGIPEPRGILIAAPFTHHELAGLIGSTRETVTLTLGELRKKGMIEIDRRRIVVLDRVALRQLV